MAAEIHALRRVRVYTEPSGSFGVDHSATLGDFTDVPIVEGSANLQVDREMLDPQTVQQRIDGIAIKRVGKKTTSLSFQTILAPTGTAAGDGVEYSQSALGEILAAVMGEENLTTGSTVSAVTNPRRFDTTTAPTSLGMTGGLSVGLPTGASGEIELRELSQASVSQIFLKTDTTTAVVTGDVVYGTATYSLASNPDTSLQYLVEAADTADRWVLLGGYLTSLALEFPVGELPKATLTFEFQSHEHGADSATVLTGSTLGIASYTNFEPIRVEGELLITATTETNRPPPLCVASFEVQSSLAFQAVPCPSAPNGIGSARRSRAVPVFTVTMAVPRDQAQDWRAHRDAERLMKLMFQLGTVGGEIVGLSFPTMQVTGVAETDSDGLAYSTVTLEAHEDNISNASTDLEYSAARIIFG